ncbi:transmembrane sensor/regulator PpyR [Metapseudomonas boanensis]|uniref:Transmembrane sensor/regulator PpyR n=1 Tax=Metapseudomonas boanensis TaxID=2822138 RepID=A0ABS5XL95_9GAMM|nr:transmembrane sensor/regulator PpyR [Pseudomonas boanensis]MBT8768484.1 transmembrane sensor/regulator PpyR [Pseudomonas boanensis]
MISFVSDPRNLLRLSRNLLWTGLFLLLAGVYAAYGLDQQLAIAQLVLAHTLVIVGPTLLKVGYVMRLVALRGLQGRNWEASRAGA